MQWYPGHMAKARDLLRKNIKLVDLILEVIDARIPISSSNPEINALKGQKPKLLILNKMDLASPAATARWQKWYKQQNCETIALNAISGQGLRNVIAAAHRLVQPTMKKLRDKGRRSRPARLMVVGIPNVGKSSLLNRIVGRKRAATGARPGITRGKQWIKVGGELELLDMPGILWPRIEDPSIGLKLAATGALPLESVPVEEVAHWLGALLVKKNPLQLKERYGFSSSPKDPNQMLDDIGIKRGMLLPGGVSDRDRVARLFLREFQNGQLGRITLELPPEGNYNGFCTHVP